MPQSVRQSRRIKSPNIEEALLALLVADGRVSSIEPAPYADVVLSVSGLSRSGLVACETEVSGRRVLLIAVPSAAWREPDTKALALRIARTLQKPALRVVLVPESVVRREPRLTNARLIAGCSGLSVATRDRMAVLTRVHEEAGCTLSEAAEVVRATDRYGTVLAMVGLGLLACDMRRPLLPWSEIRPAGR